MEKLLPFALLSVLGASHALATPITFEFTGHVTGVNIGDRNIGVNYTDPTQPAYHDDLQLINGDTSISGTYTFDDSLTDWHGYGEKPAGGLIYQFATEGISFEKRYEEFGYSDRFFNTGDQVYSYIPENGLFYTSEIDWGLQRFEFNFVDGEFTGGIFSLQSSHSRYGLDGHINGVIDNISIATVPEPSPVYLVLAGISALGLVRFRSRQRGTGLGSALLS